ncbi:MAG: arylsulfatase [Phycisphaerales bacterium]|nr:arylsulfatase [Phycisphaerales bacterium]
MNHATLGFAAALLTAATLTASPAHAQTPASPPQKTNVILIFVDDMGFSDLGCYGGEINTPNLDRLANSGMKFKQFYNVARCCPARACLLTGLYPHQAGIGNMVGAKAQNEKLGGPAYTDQLNSSCVTIAEAIKPAGYKTLMSGKWHVGAERPFWPCDRGFDDSFVLLGGGMNYFGHNFHEVGGLRASEMVRNDQPYVPPMEGFYSTDAFADNANIFIKSAAAEHQAFFLYLPFNAPHFPLQAKPEDIAKYEGKYAMGWEKLRDSRHKRQVELGIVDPKWDMQPVDPKAPTWESLGSDAQKAWSHRMAVYAAQVDCLDQNIGKVMATVKAAGIEQNTLIMFMSDNGASAESIDRGVKGAQPGTKESWCSYHIGWANASDTPFRLYKHWDHEGGISSPFIAYWPGTIKAGTVSNQVGHLIDMMPTVLDVAGGSYPREYKGQAILPMEGKSLLPIFKGIERPVHDMLFWEHEGNKAVREIKGGEDLKLVQEFGGPWELFDMTADRTEMHDLSKARPEDVKRLSTAWQAWADRIHVRDWSAIKGPASK